MGIKDIGKYVTTKTNACFTLPYEILRGEHIVVDANEMIYAFCCVVFSDVHRSEIPEDILTNKNPEEINDYILAKYWTIILEKMMVWVNRFPRDTFITFVMDGENTTEHENKYDAMNGMFLMTKRISYKDVIFDNYENSSSDDWYYDRSEEHPNDDASHSQNEPYTTAEIDKDDKPADLGDSGNFGHPNNPNKVSEVVNSNIIISRNKIELGDLSINLDEIENIPDFIRETIGDFSDYQIEPIYTNSGNIIPISNTEEMKQQTWDQRNETWGKVVKEITSGRQENFSGFFRVTNFSKLLIHDLVASTELRHLNLIYANGEADFLLALYCNEGKAFACVSRDSDQLAYGTSLQILKADSKGLKVRYTPFILSSLGINKEQLREWCILLGCDYNKRINGMGPVNSLRVVKGEKQPPSREELTMTARFDECWMTFSSAVGYDYKHDDRYMYYVSPERLDEKVKYYLSLK